MLQERISLWALWVAVLSSTFYVITIVVSPLSGMHMSLAAMLLEPGVLLHLAASLTFAVVGLLTRRAPLALRSLRAVELGVLIGGCGLYVWMGIELGHMRDAFGGSNTMGLQASLLALTHVVCARAITVPSTARRTSWASTAAFAPLVIVTWSSTRMVAETINTATWCGVSIAIATIGSRIIFGLRTEAALVRRLGQYTLEEKIGAGGMGVVYRARHAMLRRPTAIKLLPPDHAGEANLLRFEREVQMTSQLSHPNTVAIYDYGRTPDGLFYYAMEYLDGINLEQLVARDGALPPGRVIYILRQVCGALGEAHGRGLLHRDIKPANIILTERGGEPDVAKVVDFGLVKPIATEGPHVTVSAAIVLTGTPLYMPPESLTAAAAIDARSDLYALGAVGYFLLTGRPVFEAGTIAEAFGHHLHTVPVPPSQLLAHPIAADLEDLILRCLKKKVDERPASARAMERELKQCAKTSPWTTDQATEWWRQFREASPLPPTVADATIDPAEALTVSIDLADRHGV
jgi:eukaryotic-like serine/threonine-protein kinase